MIRFPIVLVLLSAMLRLSALQAQTPEPQPPGGCEELPALTAKLVSYKTTLLDWPNIARYRDANAIVKPPDKKEDRVVFMGDSITDAWVRPEYGGFFPGKPYIDRGISGQTTPQMLVRMFPDVIDLKPAAMIVLAGTNDIARNTGPTTIEMIAENIQAMTELAQVHGIKVILCSVTPISDYARRPMSTGRPPADILMLNAWMQDYAARSGAIYADYFSAMVDDKGMLKEGFSEDGLHPNPKGYALMVPVANAAIEKALR